MEKFALLAPPIPNLKEAYNARQFAARTIAVSWKNSETTTAWLTWFQEFLESDLRWTYPWWNISVFTTELLNNCVQIAGLRETSYYSPNRLCRQYYKKQEIPTTVAAFNISTVKGYFLSSIANVWPHRKIVAVTGVAEDIHTSYQYKVWIQQMRETSDPEEKKRLTATFLASRKRKRV